MNSDLPLIVQSDRSILAEVDSLLYSQARDALCRFAELEKSPEHIHTYRVTPLSLWNACATGLTAEAVLENLSRFSRYPLPPNLEHDIRDFMGRYGRVRLEAENGSLVLVSEDVALMAELLNHKQFKPLLVRTIAPGRLEVQKDMRGHVKQILIRLGYPVEDLAGYIDGAPLEIELLDQPPEPVFHLREYQVEAARSFWAGSDGMGNSGVVVLPCGAGKTVVGMAAMARVRQHTLILTTSITAVKQWQRELIDKTSLTVDDIGEYTGETKELKPVTVSTYQILTYRPDQNGPFPHFSIFSRMNWGLIIYDEVHLLPAPVFRITAEIQARRRLGLTATLVREDGREEDVFSLIGPKRYDVPWKDLESQGWIAQAECIGVRLPMNEGQRMEYALASQRSKFRLASDNPAKLDIIRSLVQRHSNDSVLIIGQYLTQLHEIAENLDVPVITGKTPWAERERLYGLFRSGEMRCLVVSKVGNFAIDLPDANVLIQTSGTFGSRQEEAQRLGRILRPKADGAIANFYSLVTRESKEEDFAMNRQLFLTEQGYRYSIVDASELGDGQS
jgi:DNA excision repair protein ERCC-3